MDRDQFRAELTKLEYRYHVHHPFDKLLQSGRASREMLRMWAANRFYYQDTIPRKDAAIIAKCPESAARASWVKHILAHDVDDALGEWLQLTRALGLTDDEVRGGLHLLPATRFACDAYYHFCRDAPWLEGVCASMTHLFAGDIHRKRIAHWPERYPWLPEEAFAYFRNRTHTLPGEIDASLALLTDHFGATPERVARAVEIVKFKQDVLWCMLDALWHHFFGRCPVPRAPAVDAPSASVFRVLGSGAGGGVPQWNRHDAWNDAARHGCGVARTQCSAAATRNGVDWVLVNCSPDFGAQWNALVRDHPAARLRAIVLTDAQLDHVAGLLSLRESADPLHVYCPPGVREVLRAHGLVAMVEAYTPVHLHDLSATHEVCGVPLEARVLASRRCKYAQTDSEVVALRVRRVLWAPCVPHVDAALLDLAAECDHVFVDGTFAHADEMPSIGGHQPMDRTLAKFLERGLPPPVFVHVNNSNTSDNHAARDGVEVAWE